MTTLNFSFLKSISTYRKFASFEEIKSCIEIPNIQREINKDCVNEIVDYIKDSILSGIEPILGTLDLVQIDNVPVLYVTDGQHRLFAIKKIYEERRIVVPIHAMVYKVESYERMESIFRIRNRNLPIPEYYLSLKKDVLEKKDILKEIESFLYNIPITKRGSTCRPNLNPSNFIEAFTKSKAFTLIRNLDDFKKLLYHINTKCYEKVSEMDEKMRKRNGISAKMIDVWSKYGWYLSYDLNFPYFYDKHYNEYHNLIHNMDVEDT